MKTNKAITTFFATILEAISLSCIFFSDYLNAEYKLVFNIISIEIFVCFLFSLFLNRQIITKTLISIKVFVVFLLAIFLLLDKVGILQKVTSVDELRLLIANMDSKFWAITLFVFIQFLQVVVIPLPGGVTILAGTLLFGAFYGGLFSLIGIVIGSIVAFLIGRKFGFPLIKWIVGEETLKKLLAYFDGRDKVMFVIIMLLPFFPDDLLCFVAGLTTMSLTFFCVAIFVTRIFTIYGQSYLVEFLQKLFSHNLVLAIIFCSIIAIVTMLAFYFATKYGASIEKLFHRKPNKKEKINKKSLYKNEKKC